MHKKAGQCGFPAACAPRAAVNACVLGLKYRKRARYAVRKLSAARAYRIAATCLPLNLMLIPHRALKQSGPAARCNTRDRP